MSKRLIEAVFAAALFAGSVWFWLIANGFPNTPRYAQVDTDYWPKIIYGLLALVTGAITVQSVRTLLRERANAAGPEDESGPDWAVIGRMAAMGLLVLVYYLAFARVGFLLSTLVFVWAAAFLMPGGRPWVKVVFSPALTIGLTVIFAYLLGLPLPRGTGPFYELSLSIY